MMRMTAFRTMLHEFAGLTVRHGGGGHPTD
jgi:hypothetical protein